MTEMRKITIDRRPISRIIMERSGRFIVLLGLFILLYVFLVQDPWSGLSVEGYRAIGAFAFCGILWLTNLIPLAVTGLLAIVIIPLLKILPAKEVYSYFGNEAVFFILGAFILAAAIMKSGLSNRLSLILLKNASDSPKKLIFRILCSTALLSCCMSEHAVAAFFFPIVLELSRSLEFEPFGGEYGKTLFLALAWGCVIGGIVTFLGGARAPLAIAIFHEMTGGNLGFFAWMKTTIFVALPLMLIAYLLLTRYFVIDVTKADLANAKAVLEKKSKKIGKLSFKEGMVAIVMCVSLFLWVTESETLGLANIAIMAVVVLFVFRLVKWRDVDEYVNWGIVLMYGGAISLGRAVDASGALHWLAGKILVLPTSLAELGVGSAGFWMIATVSLTVILLTEIVSNAAVVALIMPLALSLAHSFHMDPSLVVYAVAIPSGLAFLLPMSTPAMAIAYSSGYLKIREILLPGLILMFLGWIFFLLVTQLVWPLIGLGLGGAI